MFCVQHVEIIYGLTGFNIEECSVDGELAGAALITHSILKLKRHCTHALTATIPPRGPPGFFTALLSPPPASPPTGRRGLPRFFLSLSATSEHRSSCTQRRDSGS